MTARYTIKVDRKKLGLNAYYVVNELGTQVFPKQQGRRETYRACQTFVEQRTGLPYERGIK